MNELSLLLLLLATLLIALSAIRLLQWRALSHAKHHVDDKPNMGMRLIGCKRHTLTGHYRYL